MNEIPRITRDQEAVCVVAVPKEFGRLGSDVGMVAWSFRGTHSPRVRKGLLNHALQPVDGVAVAMMKDGCSGLSD